MQADGRAGEPGTRPPGDAKNSDGGGGTGTFSRYFVTTGT